MTYTDHWVGVIYVYVDLMSSDPEDCRSDLGTFNIGINLGIEGKQLLSRKYLEHCQVSQYMYIRPFRLTVYILETSALKHYLPANAIYIFFFYIYMY